MRNHLAVLSPSTLIVEGFKQLLTGSNWELARFDILGLKPKSLLDLKLTIVVDLTTDQSWIDQRLSEIDSSQIVRVCHLHANAERYSPDASGFSNVGHLYFNMSKEQLLEAMGIRMLSAENSSVPMLTPREKEIERLMIQGKSTDEIAAALFISNQTAKTHRKNILKKLGVKNTVQLILLANKQSE